MASTRPVRETEDSGVGSLAWPERFDPAGHRATHRTNGAVVIIVSLHARPNSFPPNTLLRVGHHLSTRCVWEESCAGPHDLRPGVTIERHKSFCDTAD